MPPLHSGDPGDGHGEDDEDLDEIGFVPPLPPDDRLWRHPSEVARERASADASGSAGPGTAAAAGGPATRRSLRSAAVVVASGMVGATMAVGAVALLGGFDDRIVEQRVAIQPVTSLDREADAVAVLAQRTAPAVAALRIHRGGAVSEGSSIVIRSDGYLLTNAHLVAGADRIEVVLEQGSAGDAEVVGTDHVTDLAVLHVDHDDLEPAALGSTAGLDVGHRTVAVGALSGTDWDQAVSTGVVTAMNRRLETPGGTTLDGMILVEGPFAPGAAGGPLVDMSGAVVGITSSIPASDASRDAFGVATPIDVAHHVAEALMAQGHVDHVWLGVRGADLASAEATTMGLRGAAHVASVVEGGPAHIAGLQDGDVVVGVDDDSVGSMADLVALLRTHQPGDLVWLRVHRDGQLLAMPVELAARDRT